MRWPQVVLPVRTPRRDRAYAPLATGFYPERVTWNEPPKPVRYGDFWMVGKTSREAWPYRHAYVTDNSESTLSIAAPVGTYGFPTIPSAMVQRPISFAPHQYQKPVKESVNLKTPSPVSWSSQNTLQPPIGYSAVYAKLLG